MRVRRVVSRERTRGRQLLATEVYGIRCAVLCGVTHDGLGQIYGVAQSTITRAVNGETFAWVPQPVEEVDEYGSVGFLSYREAVEWLASSRDDEAVTEVVRRPSRPVSFSAVVHLMDLMDSRGRVRLPI
jgi:hypothetical protein